MSNVSVKVNLLFSAVLWLFLLGGALLFVKQNIDDYMEGQATRLHKSPSLYMTYQLLLFAGESAKARAL